jgi:hypothetical protein
MFSHLKKYSKILVTGPQRSGTTICAKIIAVDTGHKFMSQAWLEGDNPVATLRRICQESNNFVIQCPGESYIIEQFSANDILIVFMMRDIKEIVDSQINHNWDGNAQKLLYDAVTDEREIPIIKYERWQKQKEKIKHFLEVEYNKLESHFLFVPKDQRIGWHIRQIDIKNKFQDEVMKI